MTKTAEKPYHLGPHIRRGVPPPLLPLSWHWKPLKYIIMAPDQSVPPIQYIVHYFLTTFNRKTRSQRNSPLPFTCIWASPRTIKKNLINSKNLTVIFIYLLFLCLLSLWCGIFPFLILRAINNILMTLHGILAYGTLFVTPLWFCSLLSFLVDYRENWEKITQYV